ncbi:hypothetical protein, partial [Bifidobacterium pseudocatenulatum]|uniref:hypothetical protein n=1 Tax=Bifidobacterium pseudocatenulatum TaxID=28026 RepID=UPI0034A325F4
RTQDAGHAFLRQTRNPKVRKKSGVIFQRFIRIVIEYDNLERRNQETAIRELPGERFSIHA